MMHIDLNLTISNDDTCITVYKHPYHLNYYHFSKTLFIFKYNEKIMILNLENFDLSNFCEIKNNEIISVSILKLDELIEKYLKLKAFS